MLSNPAPRFNPVLEKLRNQAFCLKVSCDALFNLSEADEKAVDTAEDFAEDVIDMVNLFLPTPTVEKMLSERAFVVNASSATSAMKGMAKQLEALYIDARKLNAVSLELALAEILCDLINPSKKEETK